MTQNSLVDGFMEWQGDWLENRSSAAIPVGNIGAKGGVPLSFFIATDDATCPQLQADAYIEQIKEGGV